MFLLPPNLLWSWCAVKGANPIELRVFVRWRAGLNPALTTPTYLGGEEPKE
jgi:hypothetical protein